MRKRSVRAMTRFGLRKNLLGRQWAARMITEAHRHLHPLKFGAFACPIKLAGVELGNIPDSAASGSGDLIDCVDLHGGGEAAEELSSRISRDAVVHFLRRLSSKHQAKTVLSC